MIGHLRVVPTARLAWQVVDGHAILLDLADDVAIGLNHSGSFVLERLLAGGSLESTLDAVVAEHEVSREQAREDVLALLRQLEARALIEVVLL